MRERRGRVGTGLALAGLVLLLPVAYAYACMPISTLHVAPTHVAPGQEVTVTGVAPSSPGTATPAPVVVRLDAVDGPVLATLQPDERGRVDARLVVPQSVPPGRHLLVVSRTTDAGVTTAVARAELWVGGVERSGAVGAPTASGATGSAGVVLVALGVAGLASFAGGVASLAAARRPARTPVAVRATR